MGYVRESYLNPWRLRMERWSDELVERVRKETENRPGFSAVRVDASAKRRELLTEGPHDLGTNRFAVIYQHTPQSNDRFSISSRSNGPRNLPKRTAGDADDIMVRITRMSSVVAEALKRNQQLQNHHIETIWYGMWIQKTFDKSTGASQKTIDDVAEELRTRLTKLIEDLTDGKGLVRRTAAVVVGELRRAAYGDVGLINRMTDALVKAAKDEHEDPSMRYDITIALTNMGREFYGNKYVVSRACEILFNTVDQIIRRGDKCSPSDIADVSNLVASYNKLTTDPTNSSVLPPSITCLTDKALLGGLAMFDKVRKRIKSNPLRVLAMNSERALRSRALNSSLKIDSGSSPANGSPGSGTPPPLPPSIPPIDDWWGAAAFQSMVNYVGMNTALTMPAPQIPRAF